VLLAEHEEDLTRLGGFLKSTSAARGTSEEPVRRRLWHRLPWLVLGLCGALIAAEMVAQFEDLLRVQVSVRRGPLIQPATLTGAVVGGEPAAAMVTRISSDAWPVSWVLTALTRTKYRPVPRPSRGSVDLHWAAARTSLLARHPLRGHSRPARHPGTVDPTRA
jgi:hypothetical protein